MKRKIVKHGASTLTVSLPSKWAKDHGISQGDEVEITDKGHLLVIGENLNPASRCIEINLSKTGKMLHRIIAALYKGGFDKVVFKFETPEELDRIQDTIYRFCHVYEISSISKNQVEVNAVSQLKPKHFLQMLERSGNSTMKIAKSSLEGIRSKDYNALSQLILKDHLVDRYCAYGSRIINKGWGLEYLVGPLYLILDETEISADIIKSMNAHVTKHKAEISDDMLDIYSDIIEFMDFMFSMVLHHNEHKVTMLGRKEMEIKKKFDKIAISYKGDVKIYAYLMNLFETVFEMKSAIMTMHLANHS